MTAPCSPHRKLAVPAPAPARSAYRRVGADVRRKYIVAVRVCQREYQLQAARVLQHQARAPQLHLQHLPRQRHARMARLPGLLLG